MASPASSPQRWAWLLGHEHVQRVRVGQQLLAGGLVLANAGVLAYAVWVAGTPWSSWGLWCLLAVGSQLLLLVAVCRGWTRRFADPSLTAFQMALMLALSAAAYPLAGPLRALVLPVMLLILAFGMFQPPSPVSVRLAIWSIVLLASAVAFDLLCWPGRAAGVEARTSLGHLLFALIAFPALALLALRVARIRQRLQEQRTALNEALARIEALATRDDLTGLFNRRHGRQLLQAALQRQARRQQREATLTLLLLDLDHFKAINDRHGHGVGDAVLQAFAAALRQSLRGTDAAVRWGGEEFLLLLETPDRAGVVAVLDRLRANLAAQPSPVPSLSIAFSGGASRWRPGDSLEICLERADRRLYRAKAQGRALVLLNDEPATKAV